MTKGKRSMKFRAHETFSIRKGWLSKGMKQVVKDPSVFVSKEYNPMDVLGIGSNMVKSLRYWLPAVGLSESPKGKSAQYLTEFGEIVYKNDPYIEEIGTLWLLHYNLVKQQDVATSWFFFFNHFQLSEFSKEEAVSGSAERIEELRKAVELYKGPVFMCGRDQLWLNDIVSQYEVRYIKAADALMRELAKQKDYAGVMQYAARAHELFPGNGLICYWLIMATYSLSGADMAKKEYFRLKDDMTQEEINVVTEHLKKNSLIRYEELFGV